MYYHFGTYIFGPLKKNLSWDIFGSYNFGTDCLSFIIILRYIVLDLKIWDAYLGTYIFRTCIIGPYELGLYILGLVIFYL